MEKFVIIMLLCVIAYLMFSDDSMQSSPSSSLPKKEIADAKREEVKLYFKRDSETTTKDATWTSKNVFKVGVIDDGSTREAYAQYVCQVLYRHGFQGVGVWVQVIDVMKRGGAEQWVTLGDARCDDLPT